MLNQKPVLTISLLISNRPDTIPKCLDSLKQIMDAIPSELILIDTSNSVEVHQMLLEYTDKVYEFEWCHDFAKARNEGLKRASGEWFLFLDDDEWFVEVQELIDFFLSGEYKQYGYANYLVRSFCNTEYTQYEDGWVTRVFRINEDTEFVGKVHEIYQPIRGKQKYLDVLAYHSGYVFETAEKLREHFERNSKILLEVIKEDPVNLRWQAQMVQEYRTVKEWEEIVQFCERHLSNVKELCTSMERNHFATLYVGLAEGLMRLGRHEESISVCKRALTDRRAIELLNAFMNILIAENYAALDDWKSAKKYAKKYLELYKVLSKDKELIKEQSNSLVVKTVFEQWYIRKAYSVLLYSELIKDNISAIYEYYDYLGWNSEHVSIYDKLGYLIIEKMGTMKYDPIFGRIITDACKNKGFREFMCCEAQKWEEKDKNIFSNIAYVFSKAEADYWFISYCRIMVAEAEGNKADIEEELIGFIKKISNVFYLPNNVYDIIKKYDIKIALLWESVLGSKWQAQITSFVMDYDNDSINKVRIFLNDVFEPDNWKLLLFELLVMEKQIMDGPEGSSLKYHDVLNNYANLKEAFYAKHCDKSSLVMPLDIQAALKIREYVELEPINKIDALRKLKEVVEIRVDFADGIGRFIQSYPELEVEKATSKNQEMLQLRNQVIQQIVKMAEDGQTREALQILQQLKQMLPNDSAVLSLESELIDLQ